MIQTICDSTNQVVAILISDIRKEEYKENKNNFVTKDTDSLQVGFIHREKGHIFPAHHHPQILRNIANYPEVLIIDKGVIWIDVYAPNGHLIAGIRLEARDIFIQHCGGHEIKVLEEVNLIEVKQGPYLTTSKIFFNPIDHEQMR